MSMLLQCVLFVVIAVVYSSSQCVVVTSNQGTDCDLNPTCKPAGNCSLATALEVAQNHSDTVIALNASVTASTVSIGGSGVSLKSLGTTKSLTITTSFTRALDVAANATVTIEDINIFGVARSGGGGSTLAYMLGNSGTLQMKDVQLQGLYVHCLDTSAMECIVYVNATVVDNNGHLTLDNVIISGNRLSSESDTAQYTSATAALVGINNQHGATLNIIAAVPADGNWNGQGCAVVNNSATANANAMSHGGTGGADASSSVIAIRNSGTVMGSGLFSNTATAAAYSETGHNTTHQTSQAISSDNGTMVFTWAKFANDIVAPNTEVIMIGCSASSGVVIDATIANCSTTPSQWRCGAHSRCVDTSLGYQCACDPGFSPVNATVCG